MTYQNAKFFFPLFVAAILVFVGCAPEIQKPMRVCPSKEFAADSLSSLRLRSENAVPLKANGQCLLEYYAKGKKHKKENFPVKLWVNPPVEIYLQGDIAFNPKGIVLGSNEREFWLSIKPEVSSYWWGKWDEGNCLEKMRISPKTLLEAFGIAAVGSEKEGKENWSLSNKDFFDILTKRNEQGAKSKKIYIYSCDYLVRRIEYFEVSGETVVVTELDKYKEVSESFFVPTVIKIVKYARSINDFVSITISLKSIKTVNFTEKAQRRFFTRPEPKGFKHIFRIIGANMIEQ